MVKVYKDFLRRLFLIGLHYRDLDFDIGHAVTNANDNWYGNQRSKYYKRGDEASAKTSRVLGFLDQENFSYDRTDINSLLADLTNVLASEADRDDRDLIDTIVNAIGLPYARNYLSGGNITRLKNALLVPEEIAEFKRGLETECSCTRCGHKFEQGEMAAYYREDQNARGFQCSRCLRPRFVAADNDPSQSIGIAAETALSKALSKKFNVDPGAEENVVALADEVIHHLPPRLQRVPRPIEDEMLPMRENQPRHYEYINAPAAAPQVVLPPPDLGAMPWGEGPLLVGRRPRPR